MNHDELEDLLKEQVEREIALAPKQYNEEEGKYGACPPLWRYRQEAEGKPWTPAEGRHVSACPACQKTIAMQRELARQVVPFPVAASRKAGLRPWSEVVPFPLAASGKGEMAPPSLPAEAKAAEVEFDPPIQVQGRTGQLYIAMVPIQAEYKVDVNEISPLVYQTKHNTVMVVLQAVGHALPDGISSVSVKALGLDGKLVVPVDDRPLEVGGGCLSFEFDISGSHGLADPPRFILTEVK